MSRADVAGPPEGAGKRVVDLNRPTAELRPGTMMARQWNGRMHRVAVLADGFAWNGKTYPSLSKIALAITGTLERTPVCEMPTDHAKKTFSGTRRSLVAGGLS